MKTAAAKGKSLFSLAALCLALAAVPAQAARLLPSPPRLDAAPHITELVDLDEPLSPQAQGLPLFTLEDHWLVTVLSVVDVPEPGALLPRNRYRLFAESQSLPPPVRAALIAKLASGPQTWASPSIYLERRDLSEKSHRPSFQGLWTDPATGIAYARNRWYDPHNAAWLSEDPIGAVDSSNLYAFVGWGPNSGSDPMGLCWFTGDNLTCGEAAAAIWEGTKQTAVDTAKVAAYGAAGVATGAVLVGAAAVSAPVVVAGAVAGAVTYGAIKAAEAGANRWGEGQNVVQAGAGGVADVLGASSLVAGVTDRDIATGEKLNLTHDQKIQALETGAFALGAVYGGGKAAEATDFRFLSGAAREGMAEGAAGLEADLAPRFVEQPLAPGSAPGHSIVLELEEGMNAGAFSRKARALADLAERNRLFKAPNPVARDPNIAAQFKNRLIRAAYRKYGVTDPARFQSLRARIRSLHADHLQDLQLLGRDVATNLDLLDPVVNMRLGAQIRPQIQNLPDYTPITKVIIRGLD